MQKITPFLWFNDNAEEAVNFYVSVFSAKSGKPSKINSMTRYDEAGAQVSGRPAGTLMTAAFELDGQEFVALNGGPVFKFTEAISFVVNCETQDEVDYYWQAFSEHGEKGQCGWLKDKYGVSWQIVPTILGTLLGGSDPEKSQRVMKAMLQMDKIDIEKLQQAGEQG